MTLFIVTYHDLQDSQFSIFKLRDCVLMGQQNMALGDAICEVVKWGLLMESRYNSIRESKSAKPKGMTEALGLDMRLVHPTRSILLDSESVPSIIYVDSSAKSRPPVNSTTNRWGSYCIFQTR